MNRLTFLRAFGEHNSAEINALEINGAGGDMLLTMDAIDEGEVYPWIIIVNLPRIKPRICVPAENRDTKVRC